MTKELIKIDATEFGVQKTEAKQIESAFVPMATMMRQMEDEYNKIVSVKEITAELSLQARTLRLAYVKVRTNADVAHKAGKEKLLTATRAWDGLRNVLKYASQDKETELDKIEKYQQRLEAEKKEKIRDERAAVLDKYEVNYDHIDIAAMDEDVWKNYISGVELQYNQKKEAEKKAEEDRIKKDKKEAIERERIRKENEQLRKEAEAGRIKAAKEREKAEEARKKQESIAEKERLAREKAEKELQKKKDTEQAEKKRLEDEKKAARLAPDKEKITIFVKQLQDIEMPKVKSAEAKKVIDSAQSLITKTANYLIEQSKTL